MRKRLQKHCVQIDLMQLLTNHYQFEDKCTITKTFCISFNKDKDQSITTPPMKRIEIINRHTFRNWFFSILTGTGLLTLFYRWHEFHGDIWTLLSPEEIGMSFLVLAFSSGIALLCSLPAVFTALFVFQKLAKWNLPKIQVRYFMALMCTALTYASFQVMFPSIHAEIMIASALLSFASTFIFLLDEELINTISKDFVERDLV